MATRAGMNDIQLLADRIAVELDTIGDTSAAANAIRGLQRLNENRLATWQAAADAWETNVRSVLDATVDPHWIAASATVRSWVDGQVLWDEILIDSITARIVKTLLRCIGFRLAVDAAGLDVP